MSRLRARHWFAVILALGLVVVAYRVDSTVQLAVGNTQALRPAEAEPPDGLALLRRTSDDAVTTDGEDSEQADSSSAVDPETALERGLPGLVAPLTGLPADVRTAARSALVMKIDNHPRARAQQTGLDQADIVFDLRAEGVTRFAAVFQSQVPRSGWAGPGRAEPLTSTYYAASIRRSMAPPGATTM